MDRSTNNTITEKKNVKGYLTDEPVPQSTVNANQARLDVAVKPNEVEDKKAE